MLLHLGCPAPPCCSYFNSCYREAGGFAGSLVIKNLPANGGATGDAGSIPGSGRSPGEKNGNPLQYFFGEFHGLTKDNGLEGYSLWSLVSYRPQGHKRDTTEHTSPYIQRQMLVSVLQILSPCECATSLKLCLTLSNPMDYSLPGSRDFPGKNTGMDDHALLQGSS